MATLVGDYDGRVGVSSPERADFATLRRGVALCFTLTRSYDWINTAADALVTAKDPLAFLHRFDFYASADPKILLRA